MPLRPWLGSLIALGLGAWVAGCSPASPAEPVSPSPSPLASSSPPLASAFVPMAPPDRDGDGVPDDRDRCPDEYEDCDGFEDDDGCPDPDNDRDGIADACDKCPFDPGDPPDGCPSRLRIRANEIRIVERVGFPAGSDRPTMPSLRVLDEVARALIANPQIAVVEAIGHASGDEPNAQALSERRAKRARDELIARGVPGERVVSRGEGSSKPIETNATAQGRAVNRRVEWRIVKFLDSPAPPPPRPVPVGPAPTPYCPGLASVPPPLPPPPGGCPKREPPGR